DRREADRLAGPEQRVRPLCEEERPLGQLHALLLGVIPVVEPDADDLPGPVDAEEGTNVDRHDGGTGGRQRMALNGPTSLIAPVLNGTRTVEPRRTCSGSARSGRSSPSPSVTTRTEYAGSSCSPPRM